MKIGKKKPEVDLDSLTHEEVTALGEEDNEDNEAQLDAIIEAAELTKKASKMEFADLEEAAAWICEQLELAPKKKGKKKDDDEDLPSWKEVHEMDSKELGKLCEAHELDTNKESFDTIEEAQDFVCKELKIEKSKGGLKIGGKGKKDEDEDKPSWKEIQKMDADDLAVIGKKFDLDLDKAFDTLEEAQAEVAKQLGVKKGGLAGLK